MHELVAILWTFDDDQRWEGPCDRWMAELLISLVPDVPGRGHARRALIVPWMLPLRTLAWAGLAV